MEAQARELEDKLANATTEAERNALLEEQAALKKKMSAKRRRRSSAQSDDDVAPTSTKRKDTVKVQKTDDPLGGL